MATKASREMGKIYIIYTSRPIYVILNTYTYLVCVAVAVSVLTHFGLLPALCTLFGVVALSVNAKYKFVYSGYLPA